MPTGLSLTARLPLSFPLQLLLSFIECDPFAHFSFSLSARFIQLSVLRRSPRPLGNTEKGSGPEPALLFLLSLPRPARILPFLKIFFHCPVQTMRAFLWRHSVLHCLFTYSLFTSQVKRVVVFAEKTQQKAPRVKRLSEISRLFLFFFLLKYTPEGLSGRHWP